MYVCVDNINSRGALGRAGSNRKGGNWKEQDDGDVQTLSLMDDHDDDDDEVGR